VGKSVGLHPVWLLFALSAFGTVFGFVGMLIAVPVAASIGVLTRFAMEQYRSSLLYQGRSGVPVQSASFTTAPEPEASRRRRKPAKPATDQRDAGA
jgi:hypothetical protein